MIGHQNLLSIKVKHAKSLPNLREAFCRLTYFCSLFEYDLQELRIVVAVNKSEILDLI